MRQWEKFAYPLGYPPQSEIQRKLLRPLLISLHNPLSFRLHGIQPAVNREREREYVLSSQMEVRVRVSRIGRGMENMPNPHFLVQ